MLSFKKQISVFLTFCFCIMIISCKIVFATQYNDYNITEDAYIQGGSSASANFGNNIELMTKDDSDINYNRISYVKVDYSAFSDNGATSAKLWVYCSSYINQALITVYGFDDNSWSENSITWNAPPIESGLTFLGTKKVTSNGWYCFDVTNFVNKHMGDKVASFKLCSQNGANLYKFSSSEATTNKPFLRLTTSTQYINYIAVKDTYTWNGSNANTNYGTANNLLIRNVDDSLGYDRLSYMTMDFSNLEANNVSSAVLNFYVNSVQNSGQVMIFGLSDDSWSETGVTYNNPPLDDTKSVILGSLQISNSGWQSIDVTQFVNTQMASSDKKATFKLSTMLDKGPFDIASKDSTVNKPYLQIKSDRDGIKATASGSFVDSIGVNTHLYWQDSVYDTNYATETTGIKARLDELGVRHIRDGLSSTTNTQIYKEAVWQRMNELSQLNGGLKFTQSTYLSSTDDTSRIAADYAGCGSTWEALAGLNEPENSMSGDPQWATKTRQQQQVLWNWVQSNHAELPVIGPVPGNWQNNFSIGDLSSYLSYGDIHSYACGSSPVTFNRTGGATGLFAQSVTASKYVRGSKPFVVTETGWHNAVDIDSSNPMQETDLTVMAKHLTRTFFYNWNMGAIRTFIYELIDQGVSKTNPEMRFGLLNNDGSVKPAFTAMKNIITLLDDLNTNFTPGKLDFQLGGNTQFVKYTLLQKSDSTFYLALWLESPDDTTSTGISQNTTLTFNNETIRVVKSCRIKDTSALTNVSIRPASGTPINLTLYDDVVLLEITK